MGLFGGSKSKKSTVNNVDNSIFDASRNQGIALNGDGNRVTTTDHGAVDGAFDFGSDALDMAEGVLGDSLDFASGAMGQVGDTASEAMALANESTMAALEYGAGSQMAAYEFSSTTQGRAFEAMQGSYDTALSAIDDATDRSYEFMGQAFNRALETSDAARAESFSAISESNKRMDEWQKNNGRQSEAHGMEMIKVLALAAGAGMVIMGVVARAR